ncbi:MULTISPECIES: hypothetical protein [Rhodomicrobium]|uniref:hypothetical protein n=1 Tax=Rhodomicrobium TaxID=1068 RepID=UPI000F73BF07|nr:MULTISPECIES: hypothetical protein [Rhodomicrobium]
MTARAAVLLLGILVAAQSVSVHAEPPHDHADCDHSAAPQALGGAGHDHADDHDHDAQASAPHDHGSSTPSADPAAASHGSGCCGWFCSAATLPLAMSCKPLLTAIMVAPLPLTGLHDGARLAGLFRPPRMPEHAA